MKTDTQKIHYALSMWANHIETGDISLCAEDAKLQGKEINALNIDQMKTVIRLRELARMALSGRIQVLPNDQREGQATGAALRNTTDE